MKVKEYIEWIISRDSFPKRLCGVLGFLLIMFVIAWCTITATQAPLIIDTFIWAVSILLGIDSIMTPFNKNKKDDK